MTLHRMLDPPDDPGAGEIQHQHQQDLQAELEGLPAELLEGGAGIGEEHLLETAQRNLGGVGLLGDLLGGEGGGL